MNMNELQNEGTCTCSRMNELEKKKARDKPRTLIEQYGDEEMKRGFEGVEKTDWMNELRIEK